MGRRRREMTRARWRCEAVRKGRRAVGTGRRSGYRESVFEELGQGLCLLERCGRRRTMDREQNDGNDRRGKQKVGRWQDLVEDKEHLGLDVCRCDPNDRSVKAR